MATKNNNTLITKLQAGYRLSRFLAEQTAKGYNVGISNVTNIEGKRGDFTAVTVTDWRNNSTRPNFFTLKSIPFPISKAEFDKAIEVLTNEIKCYEGK